MIYIRVNRESRIRAGIYFSYGWDSHVNPNRLVRVIVGIQPDRVSPSRIIGINAPKFTVSRPSDGFYIGRVSEAVDDLTVADGPLI